MSAVDKVAAREACIDGLAVRCWGQQDGTPILFSSGLGGAGHYWNPQLDAFATCYRLITYDHRGTGLSARETLPAPYQVDHLAADLVSILDGLDIPAAHLVGHAAGAAAILSLARSAPSGLLSATLISAWASPNAYFARCMAIRREIFLASGVEAYVRAQPLFLYPADYSSRHLAQLDREVGETVAGFQSQGNLFARMAALEAFNVADGLASIDVPVLLVTAEDDVLVPPTASDSLAATLPNVRAIRMPWGGHAANVTDPETFNAHLQRFLKDVTLAPILGEI